MTELKPDWQKNIKPTPRELAESLRRCRGYLKECQDIVDELFPETGALPPRPTSHAMFMQPDNPAAMGEALDAEEPVMDRFYGSERG